MKHPASLMAEARQLAEGGFNGPEIRRLFERRGVSPLPGLTTLHRWINEDYRARHDARATARMRRERAKRSGGRLKLPQPALTAEFKLERMRALREDVRLRDDQIARLMRHDFGDEISRHMVAYALERGVYPRSLR